MSRRDRIIGIVLGLIIGIAALIFFVFGYSGESVDAPSLETPEAGMLIGRQPGPSRA